MDLDTLRLEINEIDEQIIQLFCRRMEIVEQVADYKIRHGLPVYHPDREQQVIERVSQKAGPRLADSAKVLYTTMMDVSKSLQHKRIAQATEEMSLGDKLMDAAHSSPADLPVHAQVACQGVEGAYSFEACHKLFGQPELSFFPSFEEVFEAVDSGRCEYGVVPIENSSAGSVTAVYDLMRKYNLFIVKGVKLKIDHCLLTKSDLPLEKITDLYSHEQAIHQCAEFLKEHPNIRVHVYSNTAAAAKMVSESENPYVAAIASKACADLYGLHIVKEHLQFSQVNFTRFICISKRAAILDGADKISISLRLPHVTGSLYQMITRFAVNQLNLTKLESRPLADTNFEFLFFFDFEGNVKNPDVLNLIRSLDYELNSFQFLGNYPELC